MVCAAQVWDVQRQALHPIRAGERAADLIDIDDQKATIEVQLARRIVVATAYAEAMLIALDSHIATCRLAHRI